MSCPWMLLCYVAVIYAAQFSCVYLKLLYVWFNFLYQLQQVLKCENELLYYCKLDIFEFQTFG